ncbi:condensation domain-containing protein, partial [Xanthomonas arboricola]|uniref:condensation domain-containing protein n=1 Tax=Xanthomonas arboricola TaxID=56448 RepID=UPI000D3FBF14
MRDRTDIEDRPPNVVDAQSTEYSADEGVVRSQTCHEQLDSEDAVYPPIVKTPRDGFMPLSFAQQRLWFLAQLDGALSEAYHVPLVLRLKGPLDVPAFQYALDKLWARHEALRSVFVSGEDQPEVRLLDPEQGIPLGLVDLSDVPEAEAELEKLCAEEAKAPFDLATGPLIRARLVRMGDADHVILLTQHHIIADGWSHGVLLSELSALYAAYQSNQPNPLTPLAIQYPDYAAWQRQWLSGEGLEEQANYWKQRLGDAPVLLDLPTDRPRPDQQSLVGVFVPIELDAELTTSLKRLSQQHGVTLFMTLLAAWAAVLSRLSGQEDVVIGVPSANRNQYELEPLIGFFVNTLALRIGLGERPSVAELLARARDAALDAQDHQDLPFEQVVEIVQPPRRMDYTPLFQVMFSWQNFNAGNWNLPGLAVATTRKAYDTVRYDLELNLANAGDRIIGSLGYVQALFDESTIKRHIGYFKTILAAMVEDAMQP